MNRHGSRHKGLKSADILTYNDLLFCIEFTKNGQNGTQAYLKVHPKASHETGRVEASRVLAKPAVKAQLDRMYKAAIPDTIETIKADLEEAMALARKANDHASIAAITMHKAKLAGLLVDRQEVKTIDDADKSPIRQLVQSVISHPIALQ